MADQKISELTAATGAASADLFHIIQGGTNKKLTVANFWANVNSPVVLNAAGGPNDVQIKGDTDPYLFVTDSGNNRVGIGTNTPSEALDVAGNLAISDGFLRLSDTPQALSGNGSLVVSATSAITYIETTGLAVLVLGDGVQGQIKTIVCVGYAGNAQIVPTSVSANYSDVTLTAEGQTATFIFLNGAWHIMGYSNGVIVTA